MHVPTRLAVLVALLMVTLPVAGQEQEALNKLLVAAYSLRRRGKFGAAGAAYDQILAKVKDKTAKRVLSLEAARLSVVMGKPQKALMVYRRNHDIVREIDLLLSLDDPKRTNEALTICRYVNYPRGEALALAKLGQTEQALKVMELQGLSAERAEYLHTLKRHDEAAKVYESMQDFYHQATALKAAGDRKGTERAFEDAIEQLRFRLRDPNGPLQRVKKIKKLHDAAATGVIRERTRLALADAYGRLAADYRKLAQAYAGANRPEYMGKAPKLAANALSFLRKQKTLYEDLAGGGDAYGRAEVEARGLDALIAELEAEIASYGQ